MTTIVYNTKTRKVAYKMKGNASNDDINAACESIPNGFCEKLDNLTIKELVVLYNTLAGADLKSFQDKSTAVARVESVLGDVPVYGNGDTTPAKTPKKKQANGNEKLVAGVVKSWQDPDVRARRSQRHGVIVDGQEFPSLQAAYREFGLDEKDHRAFRMELKACMPKKLERHGKKWQAFER